jgi:hypothetical protein
MVRSDRSGDPFGLVALAGAGMMLAHQVGYMTDSTRGAGHEHFGILGPIAVLGTLVALWSAAVSVVHRALTRHTGPRMTTNGPSFFQLTVFQSILYAAMEAAERLVGDAPGTLWSLPVVVGLAAQPLVAYFALVVLRAGERALLFILDRIQPTAHTDPLVLHCTPTDAVDAVSSVGDVLSRGPPSPVRLQRI